MSAKKQGVPIKQDKRDKQERHEPKFEDALAELESVVKRLEEGDIPLEESLAAFERGVSLVRLLHGRLDSVQTRIEELTRSERGDLALAPLEDDDG
jgi:exodeoxyribonuclease VII small subunit